MYKFNKIILSRKGLDISTGGNYSPFEPSTGKYILLPVPGEEIGSYPGNGVAYEAIEIIPNYLTGIDAKNLKELVYNKSTHFGQATMNAFSRRYAHFDPWLGHCPWLDKESDHHLGAFGQVGVSQTILNDNKIGEGSLFLFFSGFKSLTVREFDSIDISPEHLHRRGANFIYGWFKVGKVIEKYEDINNKLSEEDARELRTRHPHATEAYFKEHRRGYKHNTIYIADKYLDDSKEYPGCGYFSILSEKILLTATESAQEPGGWLPSRWKMLPGFTPGTCHSYLADASKWYRSKDGSLVAQHDSYGQEFVFDGTEEFYRWFDDKLLPEMQK